MQQAALGVRFPLGMLALLVAAIAPGRAQAAQEEGLETIIVTAQKRSQAIEDVPLAVTALTAQEIEANGLSTTADLARAAPNMQFQDVGSIQVFNIRGITLIDIGDANEAPVGLYIDDVYQGTVGGHSAALYDLDRIEILRGPQGTLYGRNTTGGLVHLISRRPEQERDGHVRLETDSFSRRAVEAAIGGGLGERAAIRVSGLLDRDDGFQRNVVRGTDFGVTDRWALRLQLALTLAPDWDALLRVHGSESDGIAPGYGFYGKLDPGTHQPCSVSDIFASRCVDPRGFRVAAPEPGTTFSDRNRLRNEIDTQGAALRIEGRIGAAHLTSITSYDRFEKIFEEDADGSAAPLLLAEYGADARQFSQELRLASAGDATGLGWSVGAFHFRDDKAIFNGLVQLVDLLGVTEGLANAGDVDTSSTALYGELYLPLGERWRWTLGARYTDESKKLFITDSRSQPTFIDRERIEESRATWRTALDWRLADEHLLYASVSSGFKSGAFNTTFVVAGDAAPVGNETVTAYEVGSKSSFLGDRLRLNTAAFYNDYEGVQTVASFSQNNVLLTRFINAGDARIYGLEAELRARPARQWDVSVNLGWLDARYEAPSGTTISGRPIDGNRPQLTPKLTALARASYTFELGGRGDVRAAVDYDWKDDVFFGPDNLPTETQDAVGLLGASLTWDSASGRWSATAYIENATDEAYFVHSADLGNGLGSVQAVWARPRSYGLRLRARL